MNKKIPTIISLISICIFIVITIFTTDNPIIQPYFEIDFKPKSELNMGDIDMIMIKNTGWTQAKDVTIKVVTLAESTMNKFLCAEGYTTSTDNSNREHKINLDRLSKDLSCQIMLTTLDSDDFFYHVIVTAENTLVQTKIFQSKNYDPLGLLSK